MKEIPSKVRGMEIYRLVLDRDGSLWEERAGGAVRRRMGTVKAGRWYEIHRSEALEVRIGVDNSLSISGGDAVLELLEEGED